MARKFGGLTFEAWAVPLGGWTQEELAVRMGTKQSGIAMLESGRTSPSMKALQRMAEGTGSRLVVRLDKVGR